MVEKIKPRPIGKRAQLAHPTEWKGVVNGWVAKSKPLIPVKNCSLFWKVAVLAQEVDSLSGLVFQSLGLPTVVFHFLLHLVFISYVLLFKPGLKM